MVPYAHILLPSSAQCLLPARVSEGMVPSERALLRRPGSEEGEARRGDRNNDWLVSGRKPGGVGTNGDGTEPVTLGQWTASPGLVGKRLAESPGKYLQEPTGTGQRRGQCRASRAAASRPGLSLPRSAGRGPEAGPRGGVR